MRASAGLKKEERSKVAIANLWMIIYVLVRPLMSWDDQNEEINVSITPNGY